MTFNELLEKVRSEPDRTETTEARIASPELLGEIQSGPPRTISEIEADPRHTIGRRTLRTGHRFGPPVTSDELARWFAKWPLHPLPQDLLDLLHRANGIHLWTDLDEGRSYEGLAPLSEWQLARTATWGDAADPEFLSDRYLALSYHQDGAAYVVLNVDSGKYFLMDACGADETCSIGSSVAELLDWLWEQRIP